MPTLAGIRRRGYNPRAIRAFAERIGVAKRDSTVDFALLEHCVREDLNRHAPRAMAVLRPLKVVIENYPEDRVEEFDFVVNPEDPSAGTRKVSFSKVLYVERDDFREEPPAKFFRLSPGREVRLRYAYLVTCTGVEKDPVTGEVTGIRCTYDPSTRGGDAPDGRRVKATLHWVSAAHCRRAEVRLYESLFSEPFPGSTEGVDWKAEINPRSLEVVDGVMIDSALADAAPGSSWQFERLGYFCVDPDSRPGAPVFNRTVTLRDDWAKIEKTAAPGGA
jgi:glutaminyl-tRNA synthetase